MTGSETLQSKLLSWSIKKGDSPNIIEATTDSVITHKQLLHATAAMRKYLGTTPQTILVALPGSIVDAVLWLAALTGGHVFVPISPTATPHEFATALKEHTPDMVITAEEYTEQPTQSRWVTLAECEKVITEGMKETVTFSDQFPIKEGKVFLSSSGSTGKPKGMILTASMIVLTASAIVKSHQLTDTDRGLTPLPFHHVNAPVVSLITTILSGSCLIIAPKFSTSKFWSWVEKYRPTWISIVPTIVAMLLRTEKPAFLDTSPVRFIRTASAPLPIVYLKRFEERFQKPLIETYGISEAASTIVANPVPPGIHKPGSVGLPIGVALKICTPRTETDQMVDVTDGESGEICVKGENVIASYEDNVNEHAFQDGWFRTGDLGYRDTDGYIFITGRIKDIIIRGGENIAPREIEEELLTYPAITEVSVVGQPDPIYGEKVVGFIVLRDAQQMNDPTIIDKIKTYLSERISGPKVPSEIHLLPELPKGRTGKIDKQALKNYT